MKSWSILICTVFERSDELVRLLNVLVPQVVAHGDKVELIISSDDRKLDIGKKRQELVERARGEFISFVDDDDMVADDYVSKILPHLGYNDYIGFKVQLNRKEDEYAISRGKKPEIKITYHSLRYSGWSEDRNGYYRDISHLNPIRKSIALLESFDSGKGEDYRWAKSMRKHKHLLKRERFIDETMYHYNYDSKRSFFR